MEGRDYWTFQKSKMFTFSLPFPRVTILGISSRRIPSTSSNVLHRPLCLSSIDHNWSSSEQITYFLDIGNALFFSF